MKYLTILLLCIIISCNSVSVQESFDIDTKLVGKWHRSNNSITYEFNGDGSFSKQNNGILSDGIWEVDYKIKTLWLSYSLNEWQGKIYSVDIGSLFLDGVRYERVEK